ncbi:unnamed protein product [Pedinophyceae sp. YPF-701]|nr:unnamed protein product [Pedinophyceae sp. YPF-701]
MAMPGTSTIGWKAFTFFRSATVEDHNVPEGCTCACSAEDAVIFACDDGMVHMLDQDLRVFRAFRAHKSKIILVRELPFDDGLPEGTRTLLTVGDEGPAAPAHSRFAARAWRFTGEEPVPSTLSKVDIFQGKQAFAGTSGVPDVVCASLLASGPTEHVLAVGLSNGQVQLLQGDLTARDGVLIARSTHGPLQTDDAAASAVTSVQAAQFEAAPVVYVASAAAVGFLSVATGRVAKLESQGAQAGCCAVDSLGGLLVARHEAVYRYTPEGKGTCHALLGPKRLVAAVTCGSADPASPPTRKPLADGSGSTPGASVSGPSGAAAAARPAAALPQTEYLVCAMSGPSAVPERLQTVSVGLFDPRHKIQGFSTSLPGLALVLHAWGQVILVSTPLSSGQAAAAAAVAEKAGSASATSATTASAMQVIRAWERPPEERLELLIRKKMYAVALDMSEQFGVCGSTVADLRKMYADALFAEGDLDAAVEQYAATLGHLEPSYVLRKLLDVQRTDVLMRFLELVHAGGHAGIDHTTLLLNCYTQAREQDKITTFICGEGRKPEGALQWRLQRAAGASAATGTAQPPRRPSLVRRLDPEVAVRVLRGAGYREHALYVAEACGKPAWSLDILLGDMSRYKDAIAYVGSLSLAEAAQALEAHGHELMRQVPNDTTRLLISLACESYNTSAATPASAGPRALGDPALHDRPARFCDPVSLLDLFTDHEDCRREYCEALLDSLGPRRLEAPSLRRILHALLPLYLASDNAATRDRALHLLKDHWPPNSAPRYGTDHALVTCRMQGYRPGLLWLYERLRLPREALRLQMAGGDTGGVLETVRWLGTGAQSSDPTLWCEVLEYLGKQPPGPDTDAVVQKVLARIEAGGVLPPALVLETLAKSPSLTLASVREYVSGHIQAQSAAIARDAEAAAELRAEAERFSEEAERLATQPVVFQSTRCAVSGAPLELPSVHFLCGHSVNVRVLGEDESSCPLCAPQHRAIEDIRRALRPAPGEDERFLSELRSAPDGFAVVAEYFSRGILDAPASGGPRQAANSSFQLELSD